MDTAPHWPPQGFNGVVINKPHLENSRPSEITSPVEKRETRAKKEAPLNCPRCNSLNTKFCYYNNYSLSQPRHFCKTCKRYWTQGGSLRNIPVGGASRKNRRSSSSSSSHHIIPPSNLLIHGESQNPNLSSNHLSLVSSCYLPMICSSASTNLLFPHEELKPPVTYFSSLESHHYVNGTVHRQEMTTAKFDGLFDRVQGDDHPSIGFGMNNGMFGGEGSLWQL